MVKMAAAAVTKKQAKVSLIRLMVLPSFPRYFTVWGPGKGEEPSGKVLRPIQTASSDAEFQEHLSGSSSTIATSTDRRFDENLASGRWECAEILALCFD